MIKTLHYSSTIEMEENNLHKFQQEVIYGFTGSRKSLPSKYLYDQAGDELFQQIMAMPEYYLTDCELDIFKNRTVKLASLIMKDSEPFDLVELGAGDAMKSSYLLKYLVAQGVDFTYHPIDISGNILQVLESNLVQEIPDLKITSLAGEYFEMLREATSHSSRRKVVFCLGGNIGNMETYETDSFCRSLQRNLNPGDMVLIGFDLRKNPHIILNAYNDKAGVTAAFNLNLLTRINRELGADFDVKQFQHYQTYDPLSGACRSYLVSLKEQKVNIADHNIAFNENEVIYMEVSQKFSTGEIADLAAKSGFKHLENISDSKNWFVDALWEVK